MHKKETYNGLIKQCTVGTRTIAMYAQGDAWIVEVDYGDGYQPSRLVFEDSFDAETRYQSAVEATANAYWMVDDEGDWHCSNCKAIVETDEQGRHNWFYCYHCGKKMYSPYYTK